ncbi:MAG: MBL fold metallo-hydrolase [Gammaproteobacteria bacterium]
MQNKARTLLASVLWAVSISALADSHNAPDTKFTVLEVADGIYMLQGKGGNVGVSVGDDGMLIVDDEYHSMSEALDAELKKLGGDNLRFILNTHWHGDHTGGNVIFGRHAHIVAHTNVRKRLMSRQEIKLFNMVQEPQPKEALPVITFDDSLSIHFNGEELKVVHYPRGHTDGDTMVFFTGSNVVHMGDHYFARMFPFVDLASGGNVLNLTRNVKTVMNSLPEDVVIIPGHGPLSKLNNLRAYYEMLEGTTAYVRKLRDEGMRLEQIQVKGLEPKWEQWSKGFISATNWIQFIYQSLESS